MKKTFVIFILCLALALGTAAAAFLTFHEGRDQVTVTADVQTGDPKADKGLVATQSAHYGGQLLWNMTISLDKPEDTSTEYSVVENLPNSLDNLDQLSIQAGSPYIFHRRLGPEGVSLNDYFKDDGLLGDLYLAYVDFLGRVPNGETRTETIRMADYIDTYPFSLAVVRTDLVAPSTILSESYDYLDLTFQSFFSFPVPPKNEVDITIAKDAEGNLQDFTEENQVYSNIDLISAYDGSTLFFSFGPGTDGQLSFENTPGGFGIYRMAAPYNTENADKIVIDFQPDTLENAHPLPEGSVVLDLNLTPDNSTLLVTYGLEGITTLLVLDAETMTETQSLPVPTEFPMSATVYTKDAAGDPGSYLVYDWELRGFDDGSSLVGEDFILLFGDENFYFYTLEEGAYQFRFSAPIENHMAYAVSVPTAAAWDGDRLAIGTVDEYRDDKDPTGLELSVYDKTGQLRYSAEYETSLNELASELAEYEDDKLDTSDIAPYFGYIQLLPGHELTLSWT